MPHLRPRVLVPFFLGILGVVSLFLGPVLAAESADARKARETFQALFGEDLRKVQASPTGSDDMALASRLVETAQGTTGQGAFVALLCEHAYRLSADQPEGFATAIRAMELLTERQPDQAAEARARILEVRRKQFQSASGAEKTAAGEALLEALRALAQEKKGDGDSAEAAGLYREAATVAKAAGSPRLGAIEAEAEDLSRRMGLERRVRDVEAILAREPGNVSAREGLVRLCVVQLDDPAKAAAYLEGVQDADLKKYVPAAARPLDEVPELACLELGEWYRGLAGTAPDHAKAAMRARAKAYLERFLSLHTPEDLDHTRGKVALEKVDEALAALAAGQGPTPATPLTRIAEGRVPWKGVLAFGTSRSFLSSTGEPRMEEAFSARTVEVWFKPSGHDGVIYEEGGDIAGQGMGVYAGRLRYVVVVNGQRYGVDTPLSGGERWVHAAAQFEGGRLSLWVNGRPSGESQVPRQAVPIHGEGGALGAVVGADPVLGQLKGPGFAGQVGVFRVSSTVRYKEAFTPDALLKPDASTIYYLSASALPAGAVAGSGIKDQAPGNRGTVWKPEGSVTVVAP